MGIRTWKKYLKLLTAKHLGFAALGLFMIGLFYLFFLIKDLPSGDFLSSRQISQSTKIYDRAGEVLLYEIHGEEKRTIIPFEEIPATVKNATIAIEDENFYKHGAVDWRGIIRAVWVNLTGGRISQGGSTITQQLVKKAYLTDDRTITRKVRELALSIKMEKQFSKDKILDLYLNQIPYGSNAYGIEAASQTFFAKKAKDLTLAESALLASLPQAPSYYSPSGSHIKDLLARKDRVLDKMFELGYITEEEQATAKKVELIFAPKYTGIKAPHFVLMVQEYLNEKYGEDYVRTAGLKVVTTLDWKLQEIAEKVVMDGANRNTELYAGHNASLVAEDANTGQILSLVGSKDYFGDPEPAECVIGDSCKFEGNYNVAAQGLRQPGSSLKPFAYLAAFKKGYTPDTIVFDVPTEFAYQNPDCPLVVDFKTDTHTEDPEAPADNKGCFHPRNFDEIFRGPVSLQKALAQSINVPAIKALYLAGIDTVLNLTKDFGITTLTERGRYGLSLVLGGGEVKLIDMAHAYSVLAQEGVKRSQSFILKITDDSNRVLEEFSDQPQQIMDPQYVRMINNILSDADLRAPLFQNSLSLTVFPNQDVALKTGTTNDYRDAWAMGYTKSLVVGVWAGNNDNSVMQKRGSSILAAIPIWSSFMSQALQDRPTEPFSRPEELFIDKPMLKGQYIVNYSYGGQTYPHIHDILYYSDKNDPQGPYPAHPEEDSQFQNWEEPTITWAKANIPNFDQIYNRPIPSDSSVESGNADLFLTVNYPTNGSFIQGPLSVSAQIKSTVPVKKIEVYFNGSIIDQLSGLSSNYYYQKTFTNIQPDLQNILKIIVTDGAGNRSEKELILYK